MEQDELLPDFKHPNTLWSGNLFMCPVMECEYCTVDLDKTLEHIKSHGHTVPQRMVAFVQEYMESIVTGQDQMETAIQKLLEQQQREWTDFERRCIFCTQEPMKRREYFDHLLEHHSFSCGPIDNLVHLNALLDAICAMIDHVQCIYCERKFTSQAVLRKHMRKKKHFHLNPRNTFYDRFFIQNYIQDKDDQEDEDLDFQDWTDTEREPTECLFDDQVFDTPQKCHEHMQQQHHFHLEHITDFYHRVRFINYVRRQNAQSICYSCGFQGELEEHFKSCQLQLPPEHHIWEQLEYLFPTIDDDPLLTLDFEE